MEVSGFSIVIVVILVIVVLAFIFVFAKHPNKEYPTGNPYHEQESFMVEASQHKEKSRSREEHLNLRGLGKNLSKTYNPDFNADTTRPVNNVLVKNAIERGDQIVGLMEVEVHRDGSEEHKFKTRSSKLELKLPPNTVFYTLNPLGNFDLYSTAIEQAFPEVSSFVNHLGQFGYPYMVLRTVANISKRDILAKGGHWKAEGHFEEFSHVDLRTAYLATADLKGNPIIIKSLGSDFYFH
jgi:hypothetical protein